MFLKTDEGVQCCRLAFPQEQLEKLYKNASHSINLCDSLGELSQDSRDQIPGGDPRSMALFPAHDDRYMVKGRGAEERRAAWWL